MAIYNQSFTLYMQSPIQSVYRRILRDGGADNDYIAGFEALCLKEIKRQGMKMWAELNPQELYVELNLVGDIQNTDAVNVTDYTILVYSI